MRFKHTLIHFFAILVVICSMIMPAYAEQTMTYLLPANNHRKLTNTRLFFTGKPEITYGTWTHLKKEKRNVTNRRYTFKITKSTKFYKETSTAPKYTYKRISKKKFYKNYRTTDQYLTIYLESKNGNIRKIVMQS